jgi:hypothetical protein
VAHAAKIAAGSDDSRGHAGECANNSCQKFSVIYKTLTSEDPVPGLIGHGLFGEDRFHNVEFRIGIRRLREYSVWTAKNSGGGEQKSAEMSQPASPHGAQTSSPPRTHEFEQANRLVGDVKGKYAEKARTVRGELYFIRKLSGRMSTIPFCV